MYYFGWVCDARLGLCLSKLHLSGEHYFGWVRDLHWERCLLWVHLFGKHYFGILWVSPWLTLGAMPFITAPLWRALLWVSLWLTLGSVLLVTAPLWRALLWVSLWHTLTKVPFVGAPLWQASQFQSHWDAFWKEYSSTLPWQSSPFLQGRAGNDPGRIECVSNLVYRTVPMPMADRLAHLRKKHVFGVCLWPCDELWVLFNTVIGSDFTFAQVRVARSTQTKLKFEGPNCLWIREANDQDSKYTDAHVCRCTFHVPGPWSVYPVPSPFQRPPWSPDLIPETLHSNFAEEVWSIWDFRCDTAIDRITNQTNLWCADLMFVHQHFGAKLMNFYRDLRCWVHRDNCNALNTFVDSELLGAVVSFALWLAQKSQYIIIIYIYMFKCNILLLLYISMCFSSWNFQHSK